MHWPCWQKRMIWHESIQLEACEVFLDYSYLSDEEANRLGKLISSECDSVVSLSALKQKTRPQHDRILINPKGLIKSRYQIESQLNRIG